MGLFNAVVSAAFWMAICWRQRASLWEFFRFAQFSLYKRLFYVQAWYTPHRTTTSLPFPQKAHPGLEEFSCNSDKLTTSGTILPLKVSPPSLVIRVKCLSPQAVIAALCLCGQASALVIVNYFEGEPFHIPWTRYDSIVWFNNDLQSTLENYLLQMTIVISIDLWISDPTPFHLD